VPRRGYAPLRFIDSINVGTASKETNMAKWGISDRAAAVHEQALVWDNTFPFFAEAGAFSLHIAVLDRMRAAGYGCVTITTAADDDMPFTMRKLAHDRAIFGQHTDRFILIETVDDIFKARSEGRLGIVFSFQGTLPFERDIGLVEVYYQLGVRQALMAYNQKNFVGDGCHEPGDGGLSRFGVSLVQEMNRVGMLVDCSHTGYRTTMDVFEVAKGPVIFSHSNARALWDHERNIRDEQAKACARTGGVVGVNGDGVFVADNDPSTSELFRHIDYFFNLIGPEHVGIGLDFVSDAPLLNTAARAKTGQWPKGQGYDMDVKWATPEQLPELTELMLKKGYSDEHVRGILGGNWLRVACDVWV